MRNILLALFSTMALSARADESLPPINPLPCTSKAEELTLIKTVQAALVNLKKNVKSVPPEEAKYITAEMTEGITNPQRIDAVLKRPLVPALAIRNTMERVERDLFAVLNQQIATQHILALIDLRDELSGLYGSSMINIASGNASAFYNGMGSLGGPALFVINNSQKSFRQCISFYMIQLKPNSRD